MTQRGRITGPAYLSHPTEPKKSVLASTRLKRHEPVKKIVTHKRGVGKRGKGKDTIAQEIALEVLDKLSLDQLSERMRRKILADVEQQGLTGQFVVVYKHAQQEAVKGRRVREYNELHNTLLKHMPKEPLVDLSFSMGIIAGKGAVAEVALQTQVQDKVDESVHGV